MFDPAGPAGVAPPAADPFVGAYSRPFGWNTRS